MNLREILSNDLVKRLVNDAEILGAVSANDLLDEDVYGEDKINLLEKARYSASDVETAYFFSTSVEKELEEIFNQFVSSFEDEEDFVEFLNEICQEFDLYSISENAFEIQNNKNIEELKKDI